MPKISVIIPVYNVEKYLHECLDSVKNQTFKDIEIICINDGSTDNSAQILDEYAKNDPRIKVIHKENGGYGKAMNIGLKNATGEYISIVEPDDFVELDMLDNLYTLAIKENADIVKANHYEYNTQENKLKNEIQKDEVFKNLSESEKSSFFKLAPAIWSGIYKRDFLIQNDIQFLNTAGASYQDTGFNFKVWAMAKNAVLTAKGYYHYRTDNANSSVKNPNKIFCVCDEFKEIERYLKEKEVYDKYKHIFLNTKYSKYMWNYKRLSFKGKLTFLPVLSSEFLTHQKEGLLTKETLGKRKYKRVLFLIKAPKTFNLFYIIEHFPNELARFVSKIKG